ncbi:hypothetical protein Tco_0208313, partial [Tanacetum coccineum]
MIIPISSDFYDIIIPKSDNTHKFANKVDELRVLPGHVLGATQVQVSSYVTVFDLLLEPMLVISLSFPEVLLLGAVFLTTVVDIGFLGGTTVVE